MLSTVLVYTNNTYKSLASHSWGKSFVLKHEYEAKEVWSIVIQIWMPFMRRVYVNWTHNEGIKEKKTSKKMLIAFDGNSFVIYLEG